MSWKVQTTAATCVHPDFEVYANVHRIFEKDVTDADATMADFFSVDVHVRCRQCKVRFRFLGLPAGLSRGHARTSVEGFELRAAIEPDAHLTSLMAGEPSLGWPG